MRGSCVVKRFSSRKARFAKRICMKYLLLIRDLGKCGRKKKSFRGFSFWRIFSFLLGKRLLGEGKRGRKHLRTVTILNGRNGDKLRSAWEIVCQIFKRVVFQRWKQENVSLINLTAFCLWVAFMYNFLFPSTDRERKMNCLISIAKQDAWNATG